MATTKQKVAVTAGGIAAILAVFLGFRVVKALTGDTPTPPPGLPRDPDTDEPQTIDYGNLSPSFRARTITSAISGYILDPNLLIYSQEIWDLLSPLNDDELRAVWDDWNKSFFASHGGRTIAQALDAEWDSPGWFGANYQDSVNLFTNIGLY